MSEEIRRKALADFDEILSNIRRFYLDELQTHFRIKDFACLHLGTVDWLNIWYPFYLFGSKYILEINSFFETKNYGVYEKVF